MVVEERRSSRNTTDGRSANIHSDFASHGVQQVCTNSRRCKSNMANSSSISIAEQGKVLTKSSTRKAIESIRKDSESLIVHRDRDSLLTRYTDNLSKLSMVFGFDGDLFASKVYQSVIRNRLKNTIRSRPPAPMEEPLQPLKVSHSDEQPETRILPLGTSHLPES